MNAVNIRIDWKNSGAQERAYGPHVTDATVDISIPASDGIGSKYYTGKDYAITVIKALVGSFCDTTSEAHKQGGMNDYFSPHLKELELVDKEDGRFAVWHVRIETPFTD